MKQYFSDSYILINLIFAGIILLIFLYSGIFSAQKENHIIKSACIEITGKPCKSVGLSRSFSEIIRFRFESAKQYNPYGLKIFSFFFIQLFVRFIIAWILFKNNKRYCDSDVSSGETISKLRHKLAVWLTGFAVPSLPTGKVRNNEVGSNYYSYRKKILYVDIVLSIALFLVTFADFLQFWKLD